MTKMDGDARGGAALSIRWVSGVPIKFIGVGEKVEALEPFYPDRLASRILGMGDVLTFIEKAEKTLDEKKALELQQKIRKNAFTLDDLLDQLKQIKKMGSIGQLAEMLPGMSRATMQVAPEDQEAQLKKTEAIIQSMTLEERANPAIIGGAGANALPRGAARTHTTSTSCSTSLPRCKR